MTENVRTFEKALRESGELRRRLAEELKKIAGEGSASNDAEAMAKAAQALGYDFTSPGACPRGNGTGSRGLVLRGLRLLHRLESRFPRSAGFRLLQRL